MKIKHTICLVILLAAITFPQSFDSTSAGTDTLRLDDSTKIIFPDSALADTASLLGGRDSVVIADSAYAIYQRPFSGHSSFISHREILMSDYQSAYDLLNQSPLSFISNNGLYGNPTGFTLYGSVTGMEGFLTDKTPFSNSSYSLPNLYLLQTESIDSIEIINLPRAFLYAPGNSHSVINFIQKDFISSSPFTRIKYFEGPYGVAFFDAILNTQVFRRLNFYLNVTNSISDGSYRNSAFDSWQATAKLKYLLSPALNFIASYNLVKAESGLNGGIEVDSIVNTPRWSESEIFNEIIAPVSYENGSIEVTRHNFKVQALWNPQKPWRTQISFYSLFNQDLITGIQADSIASKFKNYSYGLNLDHSYSSGLLDFRLIGNYLNTEHNPSVLLNNIEEAGFGTSGYHASVAPVVSLYMLDSSLIPSVFYKYSVVKSASLNNYSGYGFDVNYIWDEIKLYSGYSTYENLYSGRYTDNFEAAVNFAYDFVDCNIRYFAASDNFFFIPGTTDEQLYTVNGIGLKLNLKYGPILLENSGYYYFNNNINSAAYSIPDYNLISGIYYNNIHFKGHLDIKTGFKFLFSDGKKSRSLYTEPVSLLFDELNYRIDFTLAGEISKVAVLYFNWENLTNNNYFIIPFYPMPERNIRFGVAWELFN